MATSVLGDVKSTIDTTASKAASTATGIASSGVSTIGTATSMVSPTSTTTTSTISGASTLGALPLDSARIVPAGVVWRWVDHVMRKEGGQAAVGWKPLKGLEDPSLEFTDGIKLIRLIETLSGHRAPTPFNLNPAGLNEFDSVDNLRLAFRMLRSEGFEPGFKHVYLYKPGPQRLHLLMDLLWRIMLHFRFFTHALGNTAGVASMSDEERLGLTREHLLNWVRQTTSRHIDTYRMKRIENLYHGWDDGLIYLILLHEYDPSIVSHEDLRSYSLPNQRAKSFATASSLAKRHLGIPKLLITDQGVIDEHANIAYLAEFWYSFHQRQLRSGGTSYGIETARAPRVEERYELGRTERMQRLMEGSQGSITRIGTAEYGLLPHEEERLRADQMRLEAEAERKRAEEERLKAFEARRKAESDKIAAEEEARRAMERREIALREKERLEAERRNADEERRQHLEAMRRSEVERLKMEQERKRLEDEVRRVEEDRTRALMFSRQAEQDRRLIEEQSRLSESDRLRTEEMRRMAQLKMEEAEREKLRAAEERRLAREEMLLAEQEMRIAEEERKRAELERHRYEREGLYYEGTRRESTYLTTAATMPAPRIATPTTTTTRIIETRPLPPVPATPIATTVTPIVSAAPTGAVRSVVVTPSVAPTTTTTTTTTHVISIEEKKRRKAERKARRAEEERLHAEKLRRKEEKRRLRAEAERKRLEDYVVMTQTVLVGVLHAHVVEARGLGKGVHKPYAKVKLEKQKMRTKTIKRTLIPQWRSDYTFYHSDPDARLKVRVYDKGGRFGGKRFIGRVDIPMKDLTDGIEQDLWYPLHYKASHEKKRRLKEKRKREKERYKGWIPEEVRAWRGDEQLGEIHLKLLYRKDPLYSKPGVVHDVL